MVLWNQASISSGFRDFNGECDSMVDVTLKLIRVIALLRCIIVISFSYYLTKSRATAVVGLPLVQSRDGQMFEYFA